MTLTIHHSDNLLALYELTTSVRVARMFGARVLDEKRIGGAL